MRLLEVRCGNEFLLPSHAPYTLVFIFSKWKKHRKECCQQKDSKTKRNKTSHRRNLVPSRPFPLLGKGDSRILPTGTPNVPKTKVKESFFEERSRFFGYYFEKRQTIIFTFFYRHATNPKNIQSMPLRTPGIKSSPATFFGKGNSHGPSRAAYPVPTLGNFTHTDSKSTYHPFAEVFPKKNPQFHANSLKPNFFKSSCFHFTGRKVPSR